MPQLPFVTSSYSVRKNNAIQFHIDGIPAFTRLCEVIEASKHSIFATITFMWEAFRMPDGNTALTVLSRAAARGVDVHLLFWRPDDSTAGLRKNAFWGAPKHFTQLLEHPHISIRWDCAATGYCQHQKTWVIDSSIAFLGGLNLNPNSMVLPGHLGQGQNHDLYIELEGDAVADIEHNFVQRWNFASERHKPDGLWGKQSNLEFPKPVRLECGNTTVQIQRTIHAGQYPDLPKGEQSIYAQYLELIATAQRSIYLEHQYIESLEIVKALHHALERGVHIVALLPINPDVPVTPERHTFLEVRAELGQFEHFTLAGLAGLGADGTRQPVWIHSKLMLVDDAWALIGSANLHRYSLFGNAELNAAIDSSEFTKALRVGLMLEHLDIDTTQMDDVAALVTFKNTARENRSRWLEDNHAWQGIAMTLDVATYGTQAL